MRTFVSAALAALTLSFLGTGSALASAWQDNMLGIPRDSAAAVSTWRVRNGIRRSIRRTTRKRGRRVASLGNDTGYQETRATRRTRQVRRNARRRANGRRSVRRGSLSGLASYYWQPQRVASGGWFNPNALTAAHKTLPFGTRVRVTNLRNGRSVVVRINDRGPYIRGRIIDLSRRAATVVGMRSAGVVPVRVEVLG